MPRSICFVTHAHLRSNPRLVKEAAAASAAGYDVSVVYGHYIPRLYEADAKIVADHPDWTVYPIRWSWEGGARVRRLWTAFRQRVARQMLRRASLERLAALAHARTHTEMYRAARKAGADLYVAHNLEALPAASRAAEHHGSALGFDAEDFHRGELPDTPDNERASALKARIEALFMPRCDYLTAASDGIAQAYTAALRVDRPTTVLNAFPLSDRDVQPPEEIVEAEIVPGTQSLFWFSQTIGPGRGLETAVQALRSLPDSVVLSLRGRWAPGYETELMGLAQDVGVADRVRHLDPVHPDDLIPLSQLHHVGLALEQTSPLNRNLCLTNKLLTYMVAGIPSVATDTIGQRPIAEAVPEAVRLVPENDAGAFAEAVTSLLEAGPRARAAATQAAEAQLNWDREKTKLLAIWESDRVRSPFPSDSQTA